MKSYRTRPAGSSTCLLTRHSPAHPYSATASPSGSRILGAAKAAGGRPVEIVCGRRSAAYL